MQKLCKEKSKSKLIECLLWHFTLWNQLACSWLQWASNGLSFHYISMCLRASSIGQLTILLNFICPLIFAPEFFCSFFFVAHFFLGHISAKEMQFFLGTKVPSSITTILQTPQAKNIFEHKWWIDRALFYCLYLCMCVWTLQYDLLLNMLCTK